MPLNSVATASTDTAALRRIKILHTAVWALFAGSIVGIFPAAWLERWSVALGLIALVFLECLVLLVNRMRCPLTDVAERFTDDRQANFDIYLPLWLAANNKTIFGALYVVALLFTLACWWG